jgi:hypothetical protein
MVDAAVAVEETVRTADMIETLQEGEEAVAEAVVVTKVEATVVATRMGGAGVADMEDEETEEVEVTVRPKRLV